MFKKRPSHVGAMTLNLTVGPIMAVGRSIYFQPSGVTRRRSLSVGSYQVRSVDGWDESNSSVDPADCHVPSGGRHVCADACAVRCRILPDGSKFGWLDDRRSPRGAMAKSGQNRV